MLQHDSRVRLGRNFVPEAGGGAAWVHVRLSVGQALPHWRAAEPRGCM
jgi:hypothetical protein